jgi:hypothetical protein
VCSAQFEQLILAPIGSPIIFFELFIIFLGNR